MDFLVTASFPAQHDRKIGAAETQKIQLNRIKNLII